MNAQIENKVRTNEAEYNMKIARKQGEVMICQTLIGNVKVEYSEGSYIVTQMLNIEDYIKDENAQAPVLACGNKSEVIEVIKSIFEIVEE